MRQQRAQLGSHIRVSVQPEIRAELEQLAAAGDRTLAAEIRRAIRHYLPLARESRRTSDAAEGERVG